MSAEERNPDNLAPDEAVDGELVEAGPDMLIRLIESPNIAEELGSDELEKISNLVTEEYDIDIASRSEWMDRNEKAMKVAMQVAQNKSYPWPKAANVQFPLMTDAAIQFNARAYPAIVTEQALVKSKINGANIEAKKPRADRMTEYMSYQLRDEITEWIEETDRLLIILPIEGCVFRKTYRDETLRRPCSDMVRAQDLVVNYWAQSMERAPRITHRYELYPNEIEEQIRAGLFVDFEYGQATEDEDEKENASDNPDTKQNDTEAGHLFLEQHRLLDLDDDGYEEPYIVTVHKASKTVVRIVARYSMESVEMDESFAEVIKITPDHYFTKYDFIPNPEGGIYGVGFGWLLYPLNEAINSSVNMMLDAGHLQNVGGGFIGSGVRMKAGPLKMMIGEFKQVDVKGGNLRENIYHMQHQGPSPVLFQLLGMLIDSAKGVASVKDVLTGEASTAAPVTTTLAIIEQGMKVYTGIFKRIHRSLKQEYVKLRSLNKEASSDPEFLEKYVKFQDAPVEPMELAGDFQDDDIDITPVSDPSAASDAQIMMKAQAVLPFANDPDFDSKAVKRRYLEGLKIEDIDDLWAKNRGPSPQELAMMAQMKQDQELNQAKIDEIQAKITNLNAKSVESMAKAESEEAGMQLDLYKEHVALMGEFFMARQQEVEINKQIMELANAGQQTAVPGPGGIPAVEGMPNGGALQQLPAEVEGDAGGQGF
jgi:chaperonin GroES